MANNSGPDSTFAFNNPVYGDWKVAIKVDDDSEKQPAGRSLRSGKRQKPDSADIYQTFLVPGFILSKHSDYFRSVWLTHNLGILSHQ